MPAEALRRVKSTNLTVAKKIKDYSDEPVFKKKAEKATEFLKKNGLPKSFSKRKNNRLAPVSHFPPTGLIQNK